MKKKTVIIEIGSNNTKTYFYEENKIVLQLQLSSKRIIITAKK